MGYKKNDPEYNNYSYEQLKRTFLKDRAFRELLVKPDTCGKGEFIRVGTGKSLQVIVVFIESERLDPATDFDTLFGLSRPVGMNSIIQYSNYLDGYLYTWFK